jgi:hypothetical protein
MRRCIALIALAWLPGQAHPSRPIGLNLRCPPGGGASRILARDWRRAPILRARNLRLD